MGGKWLLRGKLILLCPQGGRKVDGGRSRADGQSGFAAGKGSAEANLVAACCPDFTSPRIVRCRKNSEIKQGLDISFVQNVCKTRGLQGPLCCTSCSPQRQITTILPRCNGCVGLEDCPDFDQQLSIICLDVLYPLRVSSWICVVL